MVGVAGGRSYPLWAFRRFRDADLLRVRKPESLVCADVRRLVRSWLGLWLSSRRLAVWTGRGDLVGRCSSSMARGAKIVIDARGRGTAPKSPRCPSNSLLPPIQMNFPPLRDVLAAFEVEMQLLRLPVKGFVFERQTRKARPQPKVANSAHRTWRRRFGVKTPRHPSPAMPTSDNRRAPCQSSTSESAEVRSSTISS